MKIEKLVVVGPGLIGGSFALALKSAGKVERVVGVGRSRENLAYALERGMIDEVANLPDAMNDAQLALIAVPVAQTSKVLATMVAHLESRTLITDAGSTKQDVVAAARRELGAHFPRFVPAHPIAGGERSGAQAARSDLFRGKNVVLTPLAETDHEAVDFVAEAWIATGAKVRQMLPEEHDRIFAAVSHLPHLLAFALVHYIAERDNAETLFDFAAGGFRDFTRIASSSSEMWRDIAIANRGTLLFEVENYRYELAKLQQLIEAGDASALHAFFSRAREAREEWLAGKSEQ